MLTIHAKNHGLFTAKDIYFPFSSSPPETKMLYDSEVVGFESLSRDVFKLIPLKKLAHSLEVCPQLNGLNSDPDALMGRCLNCLTLPLNEPRLAELPQQPLSDLGGNSSVFADQLLLNRPVLG